MKLKVLTAGYSQGGIDHNKVVGVFTEEGLKEAIEVIKGVYAASGEEPIKYTFNEFTGNFFMEFKSKFGDYYYSGDYTLDELRL